VADINRLPGAQLDHWNWQLDAACRGMDSSLFFHPPNERDAARENRAARAKAICRGCPVVAECLDHALRVREPYGVWGGRTEDERARLLGIQSLRYPAVIRHAGSKRGSRSPGPASATDRQKRNSA
jgi:WhiB family redox-sensing transcriptional regulator